MKLLLDTHIFLWWILDDPRLPIKFRQAISDPVAIIFFSVASGWEISIKAALGDLKLPKPAEDFIPQQILQNGMKILQIELRHSLRAGGLPPYHRDPFDRMLVAQAQLSELTLVTSDRLLLAYDVDRLMID